MKKKNNSEVKTITLKNYIIYAVVVLITIILLVYLRSWYHEYKQEQLKIPVIRGYLNEINYQELTSYISENPNLVVYACSPSKDDCRNLESKLKREIKKYNLKEKMVYLNLDNDSMNKMNTNYGSNSILIDDMPFVAIFKEGKIYDIQKSNNASDRMDVDDIVYFLEKYEIIIE
jgi:hypothetical protein